jgi:hypothetical protein
MRTFTRRARIWVVSSTLTIFLAVGSPALAHYIYQATTYWGPNNNNCFNARSEVSHGSSGNGYWRSDSTGATGYWTPWGTIACGAEWPRAAGYYRAAIHRMKWTGTTWALCGTSGWYYSGNNWSGIELSWDRGTASPPCGSGYYANDALVSAKDPQTLNYVSTFTLRASSHYLPA